LGLQLRRTALFAPSRIPHRVSINVPKLPRALLDALLYPLSRSSPNDVYHIVAGVLALVGVWAFARREWRSYLFCFCVSYAAVLFIAPAAEPRYWWLLDPLFAWLMLSGLAIVLAAIVRLPRQTAIRSAAITGVAIAVSAAFIVAR